MDLQSPAAPSAKDHTRSPTFAPYQHGGAGPHHREALRNAEESAYHDSKSSPHMSNGDVNHNIGNDTHQYDSTDDDGDDERQNGPDDNVHEDGNDYEGGNDDEDDLEDDLLDKISSSPSIEDGKYSRPFPPRTANPIGHDAPQALPFVPTRGCLPVILNTSLANPHLDKEFESRWVSHHLNSLTYDGVGKDHMCAVGLESRPKNTIGNVSLCSQSASSKLCSGEPSMGLDDISHVLSLPDDSFSDEDDHSEDTHSNHDQDWSDEGEPWYEDESSSDDDSNDFQFSNDLRFIDTGWGGECLREVEDIDFEFVYALHTFVATVEGQANATKGDTMVLLDDSNSYWWLVRVVKDGSIGTYGPLQLAIFAYKNRLPPRRTYRNAYGTIGTSQ